VSMELASAGSNRGRLLEQWCRRSHGTLLARSTGAVPSGPVARLHGPDSGLRGLDPQFPIWSAASLAEADRVS
jgi:hypothetical protein